MGERLEITNKPIYNITYYIIRYTGGVRCITVTIVRHGQSEPSSNLDLAVCISHTINTLMKDMNPTIAPSTMDKY